MDSRTLQLLADQAQQEVDEASRREREAELQLRLARRSTRPSGKLIASSRRRPVRLGR